MCKLDDTRELILKYWKSWQTSNWTTLRACLADEIDFGSHKMKADSFVEMCEKGSSWQNVELLDSVFAEACGALLYEGTDSKNGNRIRVGEFIKVNDGKVASSIACFGSGMPPQ